MLASVRLEEKSAARCAVTSWRDRLYLAWTGYDTHINLAWSADGREVTGKRRLAQRSGLFHPKGTVVLPPALAGSGARLWLAWRGVHSLASSSVNVCDAEHPDHPRPGTLAERITESPALAATGSGDAAVAWTGAGGRVCRLTVAEDPPGQSLRMGSKSRFDIARSGRSPAACCHQDRLILAWTGTDRHINLASVP